MRLIFGQSVDKIEVESPIVCSGTKLHRCPAGGRGVLRVMSDFDPIDMKFGMVVEFVELNKYPKFDSHQLISCPVSAPAKNSANPFTLSPR